MGRSIVAEEKIQKVLATLYTRVKWNIGLIIGQTTLQKDYVLHLAPSPQAEGEDGQQEEQPGGPLESVSENWIATHARQVLRMLPGGLDILGVFAVAPPDMMKAAQAKLRQVLYAVYKTLTKEEMYQSSREGPADRIVLQVCSLTTKLTCRTFDVSDHKSTARPAEWKFQNIADRWHCIQTQMSMDHVIPVQKPATSHSLEQQILTGMKPVCDNIRNSLASVDGRLMSADEPLVPSQPSQGKKGRRQQDEVAAQTFTVQLLEQAGIYPSEGLPQPRVLDCKAKMTVRGTICCRGFVHSKATVQEATEAVKSDVIRSMVSRCELLCEDLLQAEEEQDPRVLYETPVRIFSPLCGSTVQACDYMFQDETPTDSIERFRDLLGLTVEEEKLEMNCESVPEDSELIKPEKTVREDSMFAQQDHIKTAGNYSFIHMATYAAIAGAVAGISYMMYDTQL